MREKPQLAIAGVASIFEGKDCGDAVMRREGCRAHDRATIGPVTMVFGYRSRKNGSLDTIGWKAHNGGMQEQGSQVTRADDYSRSDTTPTQSGSWTAKKALHG